MVKQIYIYLVLFVTLMMVIFGLTSIFRTVVDFIRPVNYTVSFYEYKSWGEKDTDTVSTDEEIKENYNQYVEEQKNNRKNENINSLVSSLGFVIIPLPVFFWFNRLRRNNGNDENNKKDA